MILNKLLKKFLHKEKKSILSYDYKAFISYSHKRKPIAIEIEKFLDDYKFPSALGEIGHSSDELKPIFRDDNDLIPGELDINIKSTIEKTEYLIVLCSKESANSKWVNDEIFYFSKMRNYHYIIPVIIDDVEKPEKECFPPSLRKIIKKHELLAINYVELGLDLTCVKIISYILGIKLNKMWDKHLKAKDAERIRIKEQNDRLLISQSRFLTEKSKECLDSGDVYMAQLLALEALPTNLQTPDRPYVEEAGLALSNTFLINESTILYGHKDKVNCVCVSPDEKTIVSGSSDGTIIFWDATTGKNLKTINASSSYEVHCVSFTPDGNKLVAGFSNLRVGAKEDFFIKAWDAKTYGQRQIPIKSGAEKLLFSEDGTILFLKFFYELKAYSWETGNLLWSYKPEHLRLRDFCYDATHHFLAVSTTRESCLIDITSGKQMSKFRVFADRAICFNTSGDCLYYTNSDNPNTLNWFNVLNGEESQINVNDEITDIIFDPTTQHILCSTIHNAVFEINPINQKLIEILKRKHSRINEIVISPQKRVLAAASWDKTVRVSVLKCKEYYNSIELPKYTNHIESLEDGYILAKSSDVLSIYNKNNGIMNSIPLECNMFDKVVYDHDGSIFLSSTGDPLTVFAFEFPTLKMKKRLVFEETSYVANGDGKWPACAIIPEKGIICYPAKDNSFNYQTTNGQVNCLCTMSSTAYSILSKESCPYIFAPSGKEIFIIDKNELSIVTRLNGANAGVSDIDVSEDNNLLVSSHYDKTIILWDINNKKEKFKTDSLKASIYYIAFTPDGKKIISGSDDDVIRIWDSKNMRLLFELNNYCLIHSTKQSISADGRYLVATRRRGHNSVHVIDLETGNNVLDILNHKDFVKCAIFDNDNNIISVSTDGICHITSLFDLQKEINRLREKFKERPLSYTEKKKYYIE